MDPTVQIRPQRPDDLSTVAAIYAHYVRTSVATFDEVAPGVEHWRERAADLARAGAPFLVAEQDGDVAGYAYAGPWRPKPAYRHTVEDSVYLAPDRTGRGIGRALLERLIAASAAAGARQMIAVIADSLEVPSARLHLRCGFTQAGRLRAVGMKFGRSIDTVLLQRELTAADLPLPGSDGEPGR